MSAKIIGMVVLACRPRCLKFSVKLYRPIARETTLDSLLSSAKYVANIYLYKVGVGMTLKNM